MAKAFGETVATTDALRSILGSYPFSIGLLRELISNSDDAKASAQILVLDRRTYGHTTIYHSHLASAQGPALLAYNDERITDDDWRALQTIHASSKKADTSKIGKYGVGFRASYHLTDTPMIISGSHLAILDPQHDFTERGGIQLNIEEDYETYQDHLSTFGTLYPSTDWGKAFNGTIFRLPLRTAASQISDEIVSPEKISNLLRDFAREELNVTLLFLRNITSIAIYEISENGEKTELAVAKIDKETIEHHGCYEIRKATIQVNVFGSVEEKEWRVVHAPFSEKDAIDALSKRLGGNPTTTLTRHKLSPDIDLAIPLHCPALTKIGRLFTFQPLPLDTEFPIHINALFSLTSSRQNLRNAGEKGIVKGSEDEALIEWNRLLFDTYIPTAWTGLLEILVQHDHVQNIFEAWPSSQANLQSGDYVYWKDAPYHVAKHALTSSIWPIAHGAGSGSYGTITTLLVDASLTEDSILAALGRTGLQITQPPNYITQILRENHSGSVELLTPEVVHSKLQALVPSLRCLNDAETNIILEYLTSTSDCRHITELPLVPSVSGTRVALTFRGRFGIVHNLFDETEEELFGTYDPTAISLKRVPPNVRERLSNGGRQVLNVENLDSVKVIEFLAASPYSSCIPETATEAQACWLDLFWNWVQRSKPTSAYTNFNRFYLVPTTSGIQRASDVVIDPESDDDLAEILELLNVSVIDRRLSAESRRALLQLKPSSNIHSLLRSLPSTINIDLSEDKANYLGRYLIRQLPTACYSYGTFDAELRNRLRSLPIFPLLTPSPAGLVTHRNSIASTAADVYGVNPAIISILPHIDSTVYLDLQRMSADILKYLDRKYYSPLSLGGMHEMMLKNFNSQSLEMQVAFIRYLASNSSLISRNVFDRLANIDFVPTCDGTLRSPKQLIDPQAAIATLYPDASSSIPDASQPILQTLISCLRGLKLFVTKLSLEVIRERICHIASGICPRPEELACRLIRLINDYRLNCDYLFNTPNLTCDVAWIPTPEGLKSPEGCRDAKSHRGKHDLFDKVMPMVCSDISIGENLRRTFPWGGEVPFDVLSQQLVKVLDEPKQLYGKVREIVKEIGNRNLTTAQLSSLHELLTSREWVPVRGQNLETTDYALLGETDIPEIGYCSVAYDAYSHAKVRNFLKEMGCVEYPSKESILQHLQHLHDPVPLSAAQTAAVIRFLAWLPALAPEEHAQLFIPDTRGTLRPFDSICYNDIGPRSSLVDIGDNHLAHSSISDELAGTLGLKRLGFLGLENQFDDDIDMGEDLITTIRNRLREYSDSQLLLEFVANASDAGASEFNILLDQKVAPAKALISPRCSAFQSVPALVIHNDSVFKESDFKGILRTGIGGKSDKLDTIGQFGLGALTMFHVTEFAMIVSGDHVLFLNPCKAHLSVGRASLRLPLSKVRKLYSDHLQPLDGLFGFQLPEDIHESYSYNGTLFRLPLRSEAQLLHCEPIFRRVTFLPDLVASFEAMARDCLLFTSISSIRCFERKFKTHALWSISASRSDCTEIEKNLSAHTVIITSDNIQACEWRILSISVDDQQLPTFTSSLREKYRLRIPPIVRIAASPSPASDHNLFSTLPLPIALDLPVHISASFILASDRRSIRLDEYENVEASYNRWLLQTIVPTLYLRLLEDRAELGDNSPYWPGDPMKLKGTQSIISKMVTDAVYQNAATSDVPVFKSTYHEHTLAPRVVHLIGSLHPRVISKVLANIKPSNVVELPSFATRRLKDVPNSRISLVTPKYVQTQILENPTLFEASQLELDQQQELINFLRKDKNGNCLIGLPLLPLEDGSYAKFDTSPDPCFYVVPLPVIVKLVFNCRRIVRRDLDTESLLKIDRINIKSISDNNIQTLLNDYVTMNPTLEHADAVTQAWIKKFWKVFKSLKISPDSIANYPLIPTQRANCYVSRNYCRTSSVIVANFVYNGLQVECLAQMHFTLVDSASIPRDVQSTLDQLELSVEKVLDKLFRSGKNISTAFNLLELDLRTRWVGWIRSHLSNQPSQYFKQHANYRSLPLWENLDGSLVSAHEVNMLPSGVAIDSVAPFVSASTVGYDNLLKAMGIQPPTSILLILNIPTHLGDNEDAVYRRLLQVLLRHVPDQCSVPVPNSQRLIQDSSSLYSSRDDLFLAAFGTGSDKFILPSFRALEPQLERHGLQRQDGLSIATFKTCLLAFQNDTGHNLKSRAATIFRIFSEDLPLHVNSSSDTEWKTLEDLRFIPRLKSPQPLPGVRNVSRYLTHHVRFLPDVVSPRELVREEFQPIAWSQRAIYLTEPHARVRMLYPSLSVPSATEVVNHLVVLATDVAEDHARNAELIAHLKKTYKWLDENADDVEDSLKKYMRDGVPLFLNVDDPTNVQEAWEWKPANHILLDDYDTGFLQCPRDFIKPFQSLLVAAGAVFIDYGKEQLCKGTAKEDGQLSFLERFNQMRCDGVCTDVCFTFDSDKEPLHAHRAYLAAYSTHFRDMFSGFGIEAGMASAAEPITVHIGGFSRRSMECLLDYVYTSKEPHLKREQSDLVLEMLVLAHGWLMVEVQNAMQEIMMRPKMVDPFNLDHVRGIADDTNSEELFQYCAEYEQRNSRLVRQAREGSQNVGN